MAYPLVVPSPAAALLLAHARLGHVEEVAAALGGSAGELGGSDGGGGMPTVPAAVAVAAPSLPPTPPPPAAGVEVECRGLFGTPLVEACRAEHCSQLHVLTAQWLLNAGRANVNATDWFGATALLHAALRTSVLPGVHIQLRHPAPGVIEYDDESGASGNSREELSPPVVPPPPGPAAAPANAGNRALPRRASGRYSLTPLPAATAAAAAAATAATAAAPEPRLPLLHRRGRASYDLTEDAEADDLFAAAISDALASADGDGGADAVVAAGVEGGGAALELQRPRTASDGAPRHVQLVTMLLNAKADVTLAARNGVTVALVLAASPSPEAVAVLEWVLERAVGARPPYGAGPAWAPDAVGANIVHYAAYAANVEALRLLLRVCDGDLLRAAAAARDAHGRAPLDVLPLYNDASHRTSALRQAGMYPDMPVEARRREFRTLLTTLL